MSAARNALGWLRAVLVTNPLICLYTIVMGTISVAGSLVDPRGTFQHRCAQIWSRMILATGRVRVRVRGWENVEPGHTYVFCANHMSLIDTPVIFGKLPVRFLLAEIASSDDDNRHEKPDSSFQTSDLFLQLLNMHLQFHSSCS